MQQPIVDPDASRCAYAPSGDSPYNPIKESQYLQPGSRIAHFEVLGLIGAGGMVEMYLWFPTPRSAVG